MSPHGFAFFDCPEFVMHCVTNWWRIGFNTQCVLFFQKLRVLLADFRDSVSEFEDSGFVLAHGVVFFCSDTRTT
jgi:hypothetical protein